MRTAASPLSSFFANRLRASLWLAAAVGAVALIVAVLLGFRTHEKKHSVSRRDVVAAYIVKVGRIQIGMASQIKAVDRQYRLFAKDPQRLGKRVGAYRAAERTLARLRTRLAAVRPPREARRLHTLLLELADRNVRVAAGVAALAAYLPRLAHEQEPLGAAVAALRSRIAAAKTAKDQAAAFDDYAAVTSGAARRVARLPAPSFFTAARTAEVVHLRRLSSLATEVGAALRRKELARAQALVADLSRAQGETAVVHAQRRGALAYNAKLHEIAITAKQIETERRLLERRVRASA
jgi:hypothetical protein